MADLMEYSSEAGWEVAALVHHHEVGLPFRRETVRGPKGRFTVYRVPSHGKLLFAPLSPRFAHHLKEVLKEFAPDLVHVHVPNVSAFWLPVLDSCRNLPIVVHWHADVVPSSHHRGLMMAYRFYRPFEQALLRRANAIIATSPPYLNSSPALAPWLSKCRVIPLGIRATSASPSSPEAPQGWNEGGGPRILSVGRLTYYKGHEHLIDAMTALPDARLLIVGEGERGKALRKRISALNLDDRVRLYGKASDHDLQVLFKACDCFCLPSIERTEAFGLVLLEAMRAEKPCVVTDVAGSGMSWVVEDQTTGLVVKAGDAGRLGAALAELGSSALRERLGRAGRERFLGRFTIAEAGKGIIALYEELLPNPGTTDGQD